MRRHLIYWIIPLWLLCVFIGSMMPESAKDAIGTHKTKRIYTPAATLKFPAHRIYHFLTFGATALGLMILSKTRRQQVAWAAATFAFGIAIELAQHFYYANDLEWWDIRDDGFGIITAFALLQILRVRYTTLLMSRLFLVFLTVSLAHAAPCVTPVGCSEWVALGNGGARSLIYRTQPLSTRNEAVTGALVMIHGAGRDADNYFRTTVAAAFLAGALENTIVISPRFASNDGRGCKDMLAEHEVSWSCSGDSWRSGGIATSDKDLTSYDFTDQILKQLAKKDVFPNLQAIVVAGHSAGGQYVTRYEMANKVHDTLRVPVTYVVSNPSSYAYLDASRPLSEDFGRFSDGRNCTTYDSWPYGLEKRTGYTAAVSDEDLKKNLAARPVTYLLGEIDILPLGGFDSSCPAMAQGATRLARGQAFGKYVNQKYGAHHKVAVVPLCGHNARCMFTSDVALPIIFPKP